MRGSASSAAPATGERVDPILSSQVIIDVTSCQTQDYYQNRPYHSLTPVMVESTGFETRVRPILTL
jgi:hypothetical protein